MHRKSTKLLRESAPFPRVCLGPRMKQSRLKAASGSLLAAPAGEDWRYPAATAGERARRGLQSQKTGTAPGWQLGRAVWLRATFCSTAPHSPACLAKSAAPNNHPAQIMNLWVSGYFREIGYSWKTVNLLYRFMAS